ncbi:MAG: hypothetical protein KatS3mg057_0174 [Herpetosiphonaceae bacterium]|nr:MAG: hypothetical protein KatS3mg057_0174 [Herpetosiphonaceae bacterium]
MHSIQHFTLPSAVLGDHVPVTILLPPDVDAQHRFPVLYLLHSLAGPPSPQICAALRSRLIDFPYIVVLPDGNRSFYINTADGRRYEDYIVEELIPTIDERLPTVASRGSRAIGGPSMGGFGALMLALRHRDLFSVAFSQSGAVNAPRWVHDGPYGCVFGPPDSPLRTEYDLYRLAAEPGDHPALYLDCGLDDFLLEENRAFHAYLKTLSIPHIYREHMGEHPGTYLNDASRYALNFVRGLISLHDPQPV